MIVLDNINHLLDATNNISRYLKNEYYEYPEGVSYAGYRFIVLNIEIRDWARENKIEYIIDCSKPDFFYEIHFHKESDAMLFKLIWCGNV
jgi:hypothetical protein